jgi:flagellar assembly protein FliH
MFDAPCQTVPFTAIMQTARPFVPMVHDAPATAGRPVQPDEYARGVADGQEIAAAVFEADRMALQQLVAGTDALRPETNGEIAALMTETVLRLVEQIVGNVTIDTAFLEQRITEATALINDADAARTIWLNPVDHALLAETDVGSTKKVDPQLPRGNLRIDCSDSWIEHGSAIGIEKLRTLLGATSPNQ